MTTSQSAKRKLFKAGQTGRLHTVISEAAAFEAVKRSRAVGDKEPITTGHLWEQAAEDMSDKPYKSLALDLVEAIERSRKEEVDRFIRTEYRVFAQRAAGRDHAGELWKRRRDAEVRAVLAKYIVPLVAAVERREAAIRELAEAVNAFPDIVRTKVRAVSQGCGHCCKRAARVGTGQRGAD